MINKLKFIKGYKNKKKSLSKIILQKSLKAGNSSYIDRKKTYKNIIKSIYNVNKLFKSKELSYSIYNSFLKKVHLNSLNLSSQKLLLQHPSYLLIYKLFYRTLTKKDINLIPFLLLYLF